MGKNRLYILAGHAGSLAGKKYPLERRGAHVGHVNGKDDLQKDLLWIRKRGG